MVIRKPTTRTWATGIEVIGGGLVTAAITWWLVVYFQVFLNTGFSLVSATPCLIHTSDTCSLAMSLCSGRHIFGVTRYSENLLWGGIIASGLSFLLRAVARRT